MKIHVDGLAWLPKSDLTPETLDWFKDNLVITQRVSKEYEKRSKPAIVQLWTEDSSRLGVPREFFFSKTIKQHDVVFDVVDGDPWPDKIAPVGDTKWAKAITADQSELTFYDTDKDRPVVLKSEQAEAMLAVRAQLKNREVSGALIQCPTAWGKTVFSLAMIKELKLKTAVLVHREFLLNQWRERIANFLPDAKVGVIGGKRWDVEGCHIVLVMVETIASWVKQNKVRPELAKMFGFVIADEVHRMGAPSWCTAIPEFHARHRLGVSAAPKRSDGLDKAFFYHIGQKAYTGVTISRMPKVKRVFCSYEIKHPRLNVGMLSMEMAFKLMSADESYNKEVINQLKGALTAGRKIMVFSHTVKHLQLLKDMLDKDWTDRPIKTGYYIGGMKQDALDLSADGDVIFGTYQMAKDSLDIPALDTVILAGPIRNPQQPVGRACRDIPNKKDPIVVDMRADNVPIFREYGDSRDRAYAKLYNITFAPVNQDKLPGVK